MTGDLARRTTIPAPQPAHPSRGTGPDWQLAQTVRTVVIDAVAIWLSLIIAAWTRFGALEQADLLRPLDPGRTYDVLVALTAGGWLVALSAQGAYWPRFWGTGPEEYKRVIRATLIAFGLLAIVCYSARIDLARGFVAIALPLGLLLLLVGRHLLRRWLVSQRERGLAVSRVLAVGDDASIERLRRQLMRAPAAGYLVVDGVPGDGDVLAAVARVDVDVDAVAVAASRDVGPQRLREIAWQLEGTGIELVVVTSLTDVAGSRITVNPVGGLSLLHVTPPEFRGWRRIAKHGFDRAAALAALALLSPVLLVIALLIRATSDGPVLFRQLRTGTGGQTFRVFKFRTMYQDAEQQRRSLDAQNETDGRLFKMRQDPRVTPFGRWLRRTSLDELPQLLNVVRGEMSLVGPRPLPVDDGESVGHEQRRLLVRPGITGLWQVSGRSELSWDDFVRLDLYYVENWSWTLDMMIMLRTVVVVVRGSGAY